MTAVDIPEEAMAAAWRAFAKVFQHDHVSALADAITAAAPLIVATELRRLADTLSARAREIREEDGRSVRSSGLSFGVIHLRARASELDPSGGAS